MNRLELGPHGIRDLFVLGLLAALKAATLVGIAQAVASGLTGANLRGAVTLGVVSAIGRAAVTWLTQVYSARAAIGAKETIRHDLLARLLKGGDRRVGGETTAATVGLDQLDTYYTTVLPAVMSAAVIPLLIGTRILSADWVSALVIVLTVPLVPVFMALVGMHTRERSDAAAATLRTLSDQLVELARGLPVLVGLSRVDDQAASLRAVSDRHRRTTMATLRSAFLSSLVLELISTISVAVVAVFVGIRLVHGDLSLEIGLIALVLAPECFAPLREVGTAFHASQDGLSALRRARETIASPAAQPRRLAGDRLRVDGLVVERDRSTVVADFRVDRGAIVSIEGPSGSGKSTVLGAIAGVVDMHAGWVHGVGDVAWVPQHPHTVGVTVRDELSLYGDDVDGMLDRLDLTAVAESDPARISPGELRRLAVARGLLRVETGADLLLLDEPTAHLDAAHARLVEAEIAALRGRATVIFASHEAGMRRLADQVVLLGSPGGARAIDEADEVGVASARPTEVVVTGRAWPELRAFARGMGWRLPVSVMLGSAAALFAVALTALSGWLIVRASEQPSIMYLTVAIVGVRFFGIGRAALRYAERLATHDAVLGSVTELRQRLWSGFANRGVASRSLASGSVALDYIVSAADTVRDLVPRVILPAATAVVTSAVSVIAVVVLWPPAAPIVIVLCLVGLVVAPGVTLLTDRATVDTNRARSRLLREVGRTLDAAGDLRGNGLSDRMLARLVALDATTGRLGRQASTAVGLGTAIVVGASGIAAMTMLGQSAPGPILAMIVLLPLALAEPLSGAVGAAQQWPALRAALAQVGGVASETVVARETVDTVDAIDVDLEIGWPGSLPLGRVQASARRGDWIVVEGPSGAGKSTLIATLMGFLPGRVLVNGNPGIPTSAWSPQEAHIFDSTIRGNLLLARAHDDQPTTAEMTAAMTVAGLEGFALDTRVGAGGSNLSGGERQRLAVARTILTRADVVLLDEPTAHLDEANAATMMSRLRDAFTDRIVVLVSHHASERQAVDVLVSLGRSERVASLSHLSATMTV